MLATVFSTQKFREYILGKTTVVQTDHKPLETILRKPIATAPLRLQAMMLNISDYDLKVGYLPGKKQVLADTLSRASLNELHADEEEIQETCWKEYPFQSQSIQNSNKKLQTSSTSCTL